MKNMRKLVVAFCVQNSAANMINIEKLKPILEGYKAYFTLIAAPLDKLAEHFF